MGATKLKILFSRYEYPFRTPIETSRGLFPTRKGIILKIQDSLGNCACGEIAPWPGFGCETLNDAERLLSECITTDELHEKLRIKKNFPCTSHALEAAEFFLKSPTPRSAEIPQNSVELIQRTRESSPRQIAKHISESCNRTFKIKIGLGEIDSELRFCKEILNAAEQRNGTKIRFDANGAWTGKNALDAIIKLTTSPALEFVEQPLAATPENDELIYSLPHENATKFALDESIREPWAVPANSASVCVIKPLLVGDFTRLRAWLSAVEGPRYVISSVFETEIGRDVLRLLHSENTLNKRQLSPGFGISQWH